MHGSAPALFLSRANFYVIYGNKLSPGRPFGEKAASTAIGGSHATIAYLHRCAASKIQDPPPAATIGRRALVQLGDSVNSMGPRGFHEMRLLRNAIRQRLIPAPAEAHTRLQRTYWSCKWVPRFRVRLLTRQFRGEQKILRFSFLFSFFFIAIAKVMLRSGIGNQYFVHLRISSRCTRITVRAHKFRPRMLCFDSNLGNSRIPRIRIILSRNGSTKIRGIVGKTARRKVPRRVASIRSPLV